MTDDRREPFLPLRCPRCLAEAGRYVRAAHRTGAGMYHCGSCGYVWRVVNGANEPSDDDGRRG